MHILLLDQRIVDRPCPTLEALVTAIKSHGLQVSLCCPALGEPTDGLLATSHGWPIRLDLLSAGGEAWSGFLDAAARGDSLSAAAARLTDPPLGRLREAVRRAVTRAVDKTDVDVLFVCQAGLLVEFAIETGPPVAAHANGTDLASLESAGRLRDILAASLSSCDLLAADSATTAAQLGSRWIEPDPERPIEIWPLAGSAKRVVDGCQKALTRRFTP